MFLQAVSIFTILLNPDTQMTPGAADAADKLCDYADTVVRVDLPPYFYTAWITCRLVLTNKKNLGLLEPGGPINCHPVNIGNVKQRLIMRGLFDEEL